MRNFTAMLYCYTTEEYFYTLPTALTLTSVDNGARVANVVLTYPNYFDEALNNADLLTVGGVMASGLMV